MKFDDYKALALKTKNTSLTDREALADAGLGLTGESGEVADLIKKHLYQGHELDEELLTEEIGDVLWYLALLSDLTGISIEDCMVKNILKLEKRYGKSFSSEKSINREAN